MSPSITADVVKQLAFSCGFELAGITTASPSDDFRRFAAWRAHGMAADMNYLTDHRGDLRSDPRHLLPTASSMVCVGKLYNTERPVGQGQAPYQGCISRYAWGADYHDVLRLSLERLLALIAAQHAQPFESRVCVDTAPLLERSYARQAGLGWIGKNTCLINQAQGSWFFLGELLLSIPLAPDCPPPARCGTCTRCIDACPTDAIVPDGENGWALDSRLCISYLTIEKRGLIDADLTSEMQNHVFGCDICQDVCPWNREAPVTADEVFAPSERVTDLEQLAQFTEEDFRRVFRRSPVWRTKYTGFLRNVAGAMGNSGDATLRPALVRLAEHTDTGIASAARNALSKLGGTTCSP